MKKIQIKDYQLHEKDTGSSSYQIALLTQRIKELTEHMKVHKKDNSTLRGLLQLVARRKKLMSYLKRCDEERYQKVIEGLELRK